MLVFCRHKLIWRSNLPGKKGKRVNLFAPKVLSGRGFDYGLFNDAVYNSDKMGWKGKKRDLFYIQGSVHLEIYTNNCPTRWSYVQFVYICKPLYMFRVVSSPIIRSSSHCIHWTGTAVPIQSRSRQVAVTVLLVLHEVDTVTWAADDGWRYHPKHVERFIITNKLYVVASCWTIIGIYHQTSFVINSRPVKLIISYGIEISPLQYAS